MDEELYQAFITESEESITQLNNSLLELEANPDDTEAIDDIFRQAHTLKGNFGAMGFDNAATVAHAVEDLLDEIRHERLEVTPDRMDLIFDGMDEILDILHDIEEHGESKSDPSDLVEEIRAAAEGEGDAAGNEEPATTEDTSSQGDDALAVAAETVDPDSDELADTELLYHAAIELDAGEMKGVDAGLFLGGLPDDLDVVGSSPDIDSIEDGEFEDGFTLFIAGTPESELGPLLADQWKVEHAELTDVSAILADDFDPDTVAETADGTGTEPADEPEAAEPAVASDSASDPESTDEDAADTDESEDGAVEPSEAEAAVAAVESAYSDSESADGNETDADGVDDSSADETTAGTSDGASAGADSSAAASEETANGDTAEASDTDDSDDTDDGDDASDDGGSDDSGSDGDKKESKKSDKKEKDRSISAVKSVRVDVGQLDELHELVEQLVTSRIKLRQAMEGEADMTSGLDTLDELDKISTNLQNTVMDMRLIPLKKVFDKFPRMVRDIAREQDKRVRFKVEGEDIELDRTILDEISDPLMHVLRNAVDHGIELPDEREANGKSRTGTVELAARREHDTVVITVSDDGSGINADALRDKVVSEGLATRDELNELPDEEVYEYVFHPGLSTNDEITDVSGRGVGMDVVKTTVEALDGSVGVSSTPGEGSVFTIRLPVSVAIIKVLFVRVGEREFGVPIKYIDEISRRQAVQTVNGAEVVVHEDDIFPLIRLRDALDVDIDERDSGMIVRIRPADRQVALHCDHVTRQEEVVVTPLQGPLSGTNGLSGTAVIGDGNVIPILDVSTLELPEGGKQAMREWTPPSNEDSGEVEEAAD
ncbi:chemotaxis protein histidine kinase-like protein [Halogeometricum borinquense DSM 11551]|uniref:Chemotaxis protein CheA n=1 Tax=Halogeometricum borinquense (strain ATCC 700274 / DSM 11551 / JCM 10706 / KCTC 4070 / PR3) TaxID=469382 RepID=E4NP43_HALBP|nr:chemotaxis protein CheA [Halogeometricum borinquense]ADQ67584.1 chemotaxis protein histidine kinase-like protein [Halogeometricum borinquense DSM 11551]ELY23735.1 chemotaxis protein histidine kinase-like protein [Halogeometricum borinquense DSM 11551]